MLVTGLFIGLFPSLAIMKDLKETTILQSDPLTKSKINENDDENNCDSKFIFINPAFSYCKL